MNINLNKFDREMKHLKIAEQIPSVDVLKTMEKPYVLLEEDTNNLQYNYVEPPIQYTNGNAGDIVFKTADGAFKAVKPTDWSADLGTAVGVCVIPTSHDVYGTRECAIVSLMEAFGVWGGFGTNVDGLTDITTAPIVRDITIQAPIETTTYCNIPSDKFNGILNPFDIETGWYTNGNFLCPSLYSKDGSRNTSINVGALNDFDGVGNTEEIIKQFGNAEPYQQKSDYAAKVASEMTDEGVTWYLPAIGELAYIIPRFNKIQTGLTAVSATLLGEEAIYWSSTECMSPCSWALRTKDGFINGGGSDNTKSLNQSIRSFARVSLSV